ncbi:MAG TPA: DEAD/DEAH box helicase, partial [Phycisphaerales bacterium]|nr:DEAD/DEAH box helicase [Phycisphaerales bacterium]
MHVEAPIDTTTYPQKSHEITQAIAHPTVKAAPSECITEQDMAVAVSRLSFLSTHFRREFFGRDRLRRLETIEKRELSPDELLDLIVRSEGVELLARRPRRIGRQETSIRRKLLEDLSSRALKELFQSLRPGKDVPSQEGRLIANLAGFNWTRGSKSTLQMTRSLGLPASFAGLKGRTPEDIEEICPFFKYKRLFPFQQQLVRAMNRALDADSRVMVSSFTGTGKTRIAIEHICQGFEEHKGEDEPTVLWVAQKVELLEQAIDSLREIWPYKGDGRVIHVLRYWGGRRFLEHSFPSGPTIVFGTSQQLIQRLAEVEVNTFLGELLTRAFLLVIDEAHFALAKGHQEIIDKYVTLRGEQEYRLLGLSATPGRSDIVDPTESKRLAELFAGCLVIPEVDHESATSLSWFQDQGYLSKLEHRQETVHSQVAQTFGKLGKTHIVEEQKPDHEYSQEFLRVVGEDSLRNRDILKVICDLYHEGRRMLVFCCSIEQTEILQCLLKLHGICAGTIHHKVDRRDRRGIIERFKAGDISVLLNVEVLTTGFDAPDVNTIVMCRPTLSRILYEQIVGRGLRGP